MSKHLRAAAFAVVMAMGSMAMAAEQAAAPREMKIQVGGSRVDIEPGASVSVRAPGTEVRTRADTPSSEQGTVEVRDGRIRVTGTGQTQTVTCGDDGAEVLVGGTSNQYTIQGDCKYIQVSGNSNRVRVETIGRVEVTGSGNLILWQHQEDGISTPAALTGTGGAGRVRR